jgi:hypothetical protein
MIARDDAFPFSSIMGLCGMKRTIRHANLMIGAD